MSNEGRRRFAIIGSNSFSGACFADYILSEDPGAEVLGISRSPEPADCFLPYRRHGGQRFRFRRLDLNMDLNVVMQELDSFKPSYVVNFAAQGMVGQSWDAPEQWFATNCISVMNLGIRLSERDYLKRYVHISSPEVYGSSNNETEDEAHYRPSTPYAASKAAGDMSLYPYYLNRGLPLIYTRATNVYGAYQLLYRIVPRTVLFIRMGRKIQLHGGGAAVKSYIHIKDVCDATLRVARDGENGQVYHISPDGGGISIRDLVELICRRMGVEMEDHVEGIGERFGQDAAYIINSEKIRNSLGWAPAISLEEGIDEVISWVGEHYDDLIKQPLDYIHKP